MKTHNQIELLPNNQDQITIEIHGMALSVKIPVEFLSSLFSVDLTCTPYF